MLTRKEIEKRREVCEDIAENGPYFSARLAGRYGCDLIADALAKHDALLELYHLLGGEGEPEDVVEACKKLVNERRLLEEDSYCPCCGHNRDKSSVSSVILNNGMRQCQMCEATWANITLHTRANP